MRYLNRKLAMDIAAGDLIRVRPDVIFDDDGRVADTMLEPVTRVEVHDDMGVTVWGRRSLGGPEVILFAGLPFEAEVEVGSYERPVA